MPRQISSVTAAIALSAACMVGTTANADDLRIVAWNVAAAADDPGTIAAQIADVPGVGIWALSGVWSRNWAETFVEAAREAEGANYELFLSMTSGADRHALIWDTDRFVMSNGFELGNPVFDRSRAPMIGQFRTIEDEQRFFVIVADLAGTDDDLRHRQAAYIHEWVAQDTWLAEQGGPVIAIGSFNFGWNLDGGEDDLGFENLTADGLFQWLRPDPLIPTQCGQDSVQDFVFVSGDTPDWQASPEILFADPAFCEADSTTAASETAESPRRPVSVTFDW